MCGILMLYSLGKGAATLIKRPWLLIPAIIAALINMAVFSFFADAIYELNLDLFVLAEVPDSPPHAVFFQMLFTHFQGFLALFLYGIISAFVALVLFFFYSRYVYGMAKKEASITGALKGTVAAIGHIFALEVFMVVLAGFALILMLVTSVIAWVYMPLGIVAFAAVIVVIVYAYIKITFAVVALAAGSKNIKEALEESWKFTEDKFWHLVIFLIVLAVIVQILLALGNYLLDAATDEIAGAAAMGAFWVIATAYSNMAMAVYYLRQEFGK